MQFVRRARAFVPRDTGQGVPVSHTLSVASLGQGL